VSISDVQVPKAELVDVTLLKTDSCNPNKMTDGELERLKTSVQKYGFIVPIITNKEYLIADGEQRYITAKALGMKQVSVIRLDVDDVDRRLLRQVLNKLRGEHELLADALEFEKIIAANRTDDLKHLLDLSDSNLERYLRELHSPKDEDYQVPEIEKVQTDIKRGDIIQLGKHRLMCGDSTNANDMHCLIVDSKVDLVFTDPPYGIDYKSKEDFLNNIDASRHHVENEGDAEISLLPLLIDTFRNVTEYLASYNAFYICAPGKRLGDFFKALEHNNWQVGQVLVWVKNAIVLGRSDYYFQHELIIYGWKDHHKFYGKDQSSVWQIDRPRSSKMHPTMKPFPLVLKALINSSKPGDTILDPFGGSGTTLIVSQDLGRTCYMMEIDPRYCQVIVDRWEKYTGQKTIKISENNVPQNSD
jgi:DNA modification methylase